MLVEVIPLSVRSTQGVELMSRKAEGTNKESAPLLRRLICIAISWLQYNTLALAGKSNVKCGGFESFGKTTPLRNKIYTCETHDEQFPMDFGNEPSISSEN